MKVQRTMLFVFGGLVVIEGGGCPGGSARNLRRLREDEEQGGAS